MKEAAWLLSTALPEDGRRMIKGPGRSACFRGGVTYGYRECPRKGRVRQKLRRKFVGHSWIDGLAKSSSVQSVVLERSARISASSPLIPRKTISRCFFGDRISRKLRLEDREFSRLNVGFFPSFSPHSLVQKTHNLLCDGRFTALMPAEMSYSNRLGREFELKNLMPIRHRVGVYGIRRRFLASE